MGGNCCCPADRKCGVTSTPVFIRNGVPLKEDEFYHKRDIRNPPSNIDDIINEGKKWGDDPSS